ncbi:MAG TPA: hypothetical protein VNL39_10545 [Xanthobacteraceae bacterium]|nr:hypothetical protein [Xanthobacteraceae bacterium]
MRAASRLTAELAKPNAIIYWLDLLLSATAGYGGLAAWHLYGHTPIGLRYHALHHLLPNLPSHAFGRARRRLLAQLPADSPYRAATGRRISELLIRMLRMQASHRRTVLASSGDSADVPVLTR